MSDGISLGFKHILNINTLLSCYIAFTEREVINIEDITKI